MSKTTKAKAAKPAGAKAAVGKPVKAQRVPKLVSVDVPIALLRAAAACSDYSKSGRHYLQGVRVHQVEKGKVRVVATDGHRMFVGLFEPEKDAPGAPWLTEGVIVPNDLLKAQLAMIEKAQADMKYTPAHRFARLAWAKAAPKLELSDWRGACVFKMAPVDGTFPDYQRIIESAHAPFTGDGRKDFEPIAYQGKYLKGVAEIAAALDSAGVNVFADHEAGPSVITFAGVPGAVLYLMPIKAETGFAPVTRAILAPAIKGTIAALKAHRTRTEESLKAAKTAAEKAVLSERLAEYETRIAAAVKASASNALPPPDKKGDTATVAFNGISEATPVTGPTTPPATGQAAPTGPASAAKAVSATEPKPTAPPAIAAPIAAARPIKASKGGVAKNGRNVRGRHGQRSNAGGLHQHMTK